MLSVRLVCLRRGHAMRARQGDHAREREVLFVVAHTRLYYNREPESGGAKRCMDVPCANFRTFYLGYKLRVHT